MIHFTSMKLAAKGKKGILPCDNDGYYKLVVGGLNVFNSAGQYYVLEGAKQLFEQSSIFMRKIQKGAVKSEVGHPKMTAGMSDDDYFNRIRIIEETNVCAHISDVWLDHNYKDMNNSGDNRNPVVAIWASLKPAGPHGAALKEALDNPKQNVFFSIRSFTDDYRQGNITYRILRSIVTFDWVAEGGIFNANKWDAPTLECIADKLIMPSTIKKCINCTNVAYGLETTEDKQDIVNLLEPLDIRKNNYLDWR
jgi:hypothetical protein